LIWTPTEAGDVVFTVRATDSHGSYVTQRFTLPVLPNAAPYITSTPPQTVDLGDPYLYTVEGEDPPFSRLRLQASKALQSSPPVRFGNDFGS
jgi:hypothetical protein